MATTSSASTIFSPARKRNIEHLLGHPRFELVRHDVTFPLYIEVDEIYNLACPASPIHYQHDPVQTTKTSVHGAINMLGLAKRLKCRIFQASTSEVYGDPSVHPQTEAYWGNVNPIGPRSCYDEGKRCAETLFFDYYRQHKLEIKVARIFNTYGPRMHPNDGRVVSNFIVQALKGEPITIYGDGSQTRSFCYVDDLIEGFVRLMKSPKRSDRAGQSRQSEEFTIKELAELVIDMTGSKSKLSYRAAAARRSETAPARHRARQTRIGLEPEDCSARRTEANDRLFRSAPLRSPAERSRSGGMRKLSRELFGCAGQLRCAEPAPERANRNYRACSINLIFDAITSRWQSRLALRWAGAQRRAALPPSV